MASGAGDAIPHRISSATSQPEPNHTPAQDSKSPPRLGSEPSHLSATSALSTLTNTPLIGAAKQARDKGGKRSEKRKASEITSWLPVTKRGSLLQRTWPDRMPRAQAGRRPCPHGCRSADAGLPFLHLPKHGSTLVPRWRGLAHWLGTTCGCRPAERVRGALSLGKHSSSMPAAVTRHSMNRREERNPKRTVVREQQRRREKGETVGAEP